MQFLSFLAFVFHCLSDNNNKHTFRDTESKEMHEKEIKGWLTTVALYQRRPLKKINRLVEKPPFRIFAQVKPSVERTFLPPFGFKLNVIDLLFQ